MKTLLIILEAIFGGVIGFIAGFIVIFTIVIAIDRISAVYLYFKRKGKPDLNGDPVHDYMVLSLGHHGEGGVAQKLKEYEKT